MNIKTKVKAGRLAANHNATVMKVRTKVKGGKLAANHNAAVR